MGVSIMNIDMITDDYTIDDWTGHAVINLSEGSEVNIGVREGKLVHWECIKGGMEKPTEQEIADEVTRLKELYASQKYARERRLAYPNIGDQLDALYHAGLFPKEMADKIKAVKEQFPKPEQLNGD